METPGIVLRKGSKAKEDVRAWQERLAQMGLYKGKIDGIFGDMTRKATLAFQKSAGMVQDGVVGPDTRKAQLPVPRPRPGTKDVVGSAPVEPVTSAPLAPLKESFAQRAGTELAPAPALGLPKGGASTTTEGDPGMEPGMLPGNPYLEELIFNQLGLKRQPQVDLTGSRYDPKGVK